MVDVAPKAPRRKKLPHAPVLNVTLTEEGIAHAERRDSSHCVWADQIRASYPHFRNVSVDIQTIRVTDPQKGLRYTYLTPRVAQVTLVQFDAGLHTEPGLSIRLRNGQVTRAGASQIKRSSTQVRDAVPNAHQTPVMRSTHESLVPDVIGGKTPPIGPLSNTAYRGKRRQFGLRGLVL